MLLKERVWEVVRELSPSVSPQNNQREYHHLLDTPWYMVHINHTRTAAEDGNGLLVVVDADIVFSSSCLGHVGQFGVSNSQSIRRQLECENASSRRDVAASSQTSTW